MKWRLFVSFVLLFVLLGNFTSFTYGESVVEKYFHQMTQEEKDRVLANLISEGQVPNSIKLKGKKYSLNITNWNDLGVISYGSLSTVNAENQNTSHSNFRDGQWRYLGYDMYGGLYGNDNFPPDYPSTRPGEDKNWLTTVQIKGSMSARRLIGESNVEKDSDFSLSEKLATASLFLSKNPGWRAKGKDENYIIQHFFFNAVTNENGLTQGQFVGVHSLGGGVIRYQTFAVEAKMKFIIPPKEVPVEEEEEPEIIVPEIDVGVNCQLGLALETYVTHPTLAEDRSVFNLEGEIYSATRAYEEGLASNSFRVLEGGASTRKLSHTKAELVFNKSGLHNVQLTVDAKGGNSGSDRKSIQVKPTPSIIHSLSGTKKQNRKQVLNIKVAKRSDTNLKDFWVKLEYLDKEEKVTLHHNLGGENTLSNSQHIKTRPIERLASSSMYFEECKLEFLLKNKETANCRYTIYVKDSLGNEDLVSADFPVEPDRPPLAEIFLEGGYVREANSDIAIITVEDMSTSDGDQIERSWFFQDGQDPDELWTPILPGSLGYEDHSFGSGKKIAFQKYGVGPFKVKLLAKDLWTEETLHEYIGDEDRLESQVEGGSEVINLAPLVGLEAIKLQKANITMLVGGQEEENKAKENKGVLEAELLEKGIDANIQISRMYPTATGEKTPGARTSMSVKTPFGFQGNWLFYEDDNYIVDDNCLYKIDASWPGTSLEEYPTSPYTISCWRHTGEYLWGFSFTEDLMDVPNVRSGPYFAQDDLGEYLFFVAGGKSLVVSKANGNLLTVLDYELGRNVYACRGNIYTVKNDGIYKISTLTGRENRVFVGNILNGKTEKLEGLVNFVVKIGAKYYRGLFNPQNEKTNLEELFFIDPVYGSSSHKVLAIDTEGKIVIATDTAGVYTSGGSTGNVSNYVSRLHVYGRDNKLIYQSPSKSDSSSGQYFAFPILNEEGTCNYVGHTYRSRSGTNRYVYAEIYRISDGFSLIGNVRNTNSEYPTVFNKILYAREIDGLVHVGTGAEWVYVWNAGYGIYGERTRAFTFDFENEGVEVGNSCDAMGIGLSTFETGRSSNVLGAVQAGYNQPGNSYSLTEVVKWDQNLEEILKRNVNKHFAGGQDINVLVIYDETNRLEFYSEEVIARLEETVKAKKAKLVLATSEDVEGDGLLYELLDWEGGNNSLLKIKTPADAVGQMSKTYCLGANEKYYFEYECFGDVDVGFVHESLATEGAEFASSRYNIKESFYEDFTNPGRYNPFFDLNSELIGGGYYKGAYCQTRKSGKNHFVASSSELHFTVPEGEKAFLSFEYLMQKNSYDSNWTQSYVAIDGKLWENYAPMGKVGHYSHPHLLEEGEHTLTFIARQYGSGESEARMWLSFLSVDLVEETEVSTKIQDAVLEDVSVERLGNGYKKVRGSFRTPPTTTAYGQLENAIVSKGAPGVNPYTLVTNANEDRRAFRVNVPDGYTAILTRVPTSSYSAWGDRNVNYASGSDRWTYIPKFDWPEESMYAWPSNGVIVTGPYSGYRDFSLTASAYRSTYGNFGEVSLVMVDSDNTGWKDLKHFLTGDGGINKFFLQTGTYEGTRVVFKFPEGDHQLKNLKLYHIKDGMEVLSEREALASSAKLTEWQVENAEVDFINEDIFDQDQEDTRSLVYKKGEKISYDISYFDYEGDPSKKQYWKYSHEPFNDGLHISAGAILHEPIDRFYQDGKYIVEHWQEDNTSRPLIAEGNPEYDKLSNVVSITFYIEGGGSGPWIESIKTIPASVKEGDELQIEVRVDDVEKDVLSLRTELYKEGELIYVHEKDKIEADGAGRYPPVVTGIVPVEIWAGSYEVVCVVRDEDGAGLANYGFNVVSEGNITGMVRHTNQWEVNRKQFNSNYFKEDVNRAFTFNEYMAMKAPRKRGTNVFWSGERFMLEAFVAGKPLKVDVSIKGFPEYRGSLTRAGERNNKNEEKYVGELWDRSMLNKWGRSNPRELTFVFVSEYLGGVVKTHEEKVIVDSNIEYWLLHRVW